MLSKAAVEGAVGVSYAKAPRQKRGPSMHSRVDKQSGNKGV